MGWCLNLLPPHQKKQDIHCNKTFTLCFNLKSTPPFPETNSSPLKKECSLSNHQFAGGYCRSISGRVHYQPKLHPLFLLAIPSRLPCICIVWSPQKNWWHWITNVNLDISDVSENSGTPKLSILIGCSIINHSFWDAPILETPISRIARFFAIWHRYKSAVRAVGRFHRFAWRRGISVHVENSWGFLDVLKEPKHSMVWYIYLLIHHTNKPKCSSIHLNVWCFGVFILVLLVNVPYIECPGLRRN